MFDDIYVLIENTLIIMKCLRISEQIHSDWVVSVALYDT